jgi:hypothetical protein
MVIAARRDHPHAKAARRAHVVEAKQFVVEAAQSLPDIGIMGNSARLLRQK